MIFRAKREKTWLMLMSSLADVSKKGDPHFNPNSTLSSVLTSLFSLQSLLFPKVLIYFESFFKFDEKKKKKKKNTNKNEREFNCFFDSYYLISYITQIFKCTHLCQRIDQNKSLPIFHVEIPHCSKLEKKNNKM